jgi:hypothetical protein
LTFRDMIDESVTLECETALGVHRGIAVAGPYGAAGQILVWSNLKGPNGRGGQNAEQRRVALRRLIVFFGGAGNQHRIGSRLTRYFRRLQFSFRFGCFVGHDAIVEEVAHRTCFDSEVYILW